MTRNPLVIDIGAAVVIVILVLVIEPGVAIAAILALVLLVVCAVSFLIGRRRPRRVAQPRLRRR